MKIFKKVMVLVLVVGMTLGLSACGNSSKSSDAASKNDDSVLVVGFDQNFPPFGYKNKKGKFVGFDIEAAKACAKEMGVDIKLQPIDWDSKDMELNPEPLIVSGMVLPSMDVKRNIHGQNHI